MTTNNKAQLLEERRALVRANDTAELQINELPDDLRASLVQIIKAGIESNNAKITRIDEELRRMALAEEHERCKGINNKVLDLVNTHILGALSSDELDTLAKCSGISIRFTRDKETGEVSATSTVGSAGRVPRHSSSDRPAEARERRTRRMIYDTMIRRKFSTWAGVLSAYGLSANGSSALKVAAAMFTDFATRFVDDQNINFVEELMDKTVPYTIGTAEEAYPDDYQPQEVMGGTPVHVDDMPTHQTETQSADETASTQEPDDSESTDRTADKPAIQRRRPSKESQYQ